MSNVELVKQAILDFDDLAEEEHEERQENSSYVGEYIDLNNFCNILLGDSDTGVEEVDLKELGIAKLVVDNIADCADGQCWLIFVLANKFYKIEGYMSAPLMSSAYGGEDWDVTTLSEVTPVAKIIRVFE